MLKRSMNIEHGLWTFCYSCSYCTVQCILYTCILNILYSVHHKKNFLFGIKILAQHLDKSLADFWTSLLSMCIVPKEKRRVGGGEGIIEKEKVCSRVRKIMPNSLVYSPENTTGNCV